jgi:hypothetical protein
MATALVQHPVRQGEYKSTDVALLTPHTGQLRKLRTSLGKDFEICLREQDLKIHLDCQVVWPLEHEGALGVSRNSEPC